MFVFLVAAALVALAFWQRSNFLMIISGIVAVGFGIYWITLSTDFLYIMEGTAAVAIGIYMLINTGVEMIRK